MMLYLMNYWFELVRLLGDIINENIRVMTDKKNRCENASFCAEIPSVNTEWRLRRTRID